MKSALPAFGLFLLLSAVPAFAECEVKTITAKSGETVDVLPVYGAARRGAEGEEDEGEGGGGMSDDINAPRVSAQKPRCEFDARGNA